MAGLAHQHQHQGYRHHRSSGSTGSVGAGGSGSGGGNEGGGQEGASPIARVRLLSCIPAANPCDTWQQPSVLQLSFTVHLPIRRVVRRCTCCCSTSNAFSLNFRRQSCPVIPTNSRRFALSHTSTNADEPVFLRGHPIAHVTSSFVYPQSRSPPHGPRRSRGRPTSRVARRSTSPILLSH